MSISSSHLEEEFGRFGVVKPGGVNVKSQKVHIYHCVRPSSRSFTFMTYLIFVMAVNELFGSSSKEYPMRLLNLRKLLQLNLLLRYS
jgi:hypothetical protein